MAQMRNHSTDVTAAMRAQFDTFRRRERRALAARVLNIVGTRTGADGRPFVAVADLRAHDAELRSLLGHVRAFYTAKERQRLYKNNVHLGASVGALLLSTAAGVQAVAGRGGIGAGFSVAW